MATLLAPGTWAVENHGDSEIAAFGDWLEQNSQSVTLLKGGAGDSVVFAPGGFSELVVFAVHLPVEWTLPSTPAPFVFPKEERADAEPAAVKPESPGKGKPEGASFGGGLFSLDQLVWAIIVGLYLYSKKGKN